VPAVNEQIHFNCSIEDAYKVISDFASYPEFVDGVDEIVILKETKTTITAQYQLNLIKKFTYVIKVKKSAPKKISWELESGDIFKKNSGSWSFKESDGGVLADYTLDVDFKLFVPKMVIKKIMATTLPSMLKSFKKRCER
jgi:ribosome-associated toxin RatA of RatAB toxin-antitoxin module